MVAGILENDTMVYEVDGGKPWHNLGKGVHNMSPTEMQEASNTNWEVQKFNSTINVNGEIIETGQQALVRMDTNTVLTNVGPNWNPVQNSEAFNFFNEFVNEAGDMSMETAGSLQNGKYVWALAKLNNPLELANGKEIFQPYLLFSNPHIYGRGVNVKFLMTRVVCENTLSWGLSEYSENQVRLNHQKVFDSVMVKNALGLAQNHTSLLTDKVDLLTSKRYDEESLDRFITAIFGKSEKEGEKLTRTGTKIKELVETSKGYENFEGSWWNALNAVTYYTDHVSGKPESRLVSQWFGASASKKLSALEMAVEMAEAV